MDQLNIANGVREFAVASPSAVAVVDDAMPVGKQTLTYAQLDERASRLANALAAAGLVPGDRVGVLLGNRLEYPEIAAGLAKGGFVMVPVNPRLTGAEASYILGHAGARALVADDALAAVGQPGVDEHGIAPSCRSTAPRWAATTRQPWPPPTRSTHASRWRRPTRSASPTPRARRAGRRA
jgi:acyl-CoA synthetase (AMP-forming)/AMP-acid ligase II